MKYELFKVKRGKELLGEYILTDIRDLMESGVLLPSDLYKSKDSAYWLPLTLSINETVQRAPSKKRRFTPAELKLQRQADTLANQSLYLISKKHGTSKQSKRR
jgi:hypothetical protein